MKKWLVKIPVEGTATIPVEQDEEPKPYDANISNKLHTGFFDYGMARYFRNKANVEETNDRTYESYVKDAIKNKQKKASIADKIKRIAVQAMAAFTMFKMKSVPEYNKAVDILNKAIDTMGTQHFNFGRNDRELYVTIQDRKNAEIVEGLLNKAGIKYIIDEGVRRTAVLTPKHFDPTIKVDVKTHYGTDHIYITSDHAEAIAALTGRKTLTDRDLQALKALGFSIYHKPERKMMASRTANLNKDMEPLPLIKKSRHISEEYMICPHCAAEIGEKEFYHDGKTWFHSRCGNPVKW